jgi:hypothetical protein
MKFDNAYDLILHLFDNGLLKGIDLGIRGEYTIESSIQDTDLLKLLTEIFGKWRWGPCVACDEGYYDLVKDENGELGFSVSISSDIMDFHGNPFEIEDILKIIVDELGLTKVDAEEYLEYQLVLDLDLDYPDINDSDFDLSEFEIHGETEGDEIDKEIINNLKKSDIFKLKLVIVDYLVKVHRENHDNFTGFSLSIDRNYIGPYYGTGHEFIDGLKEFFAAYPIEYELD